MASEKNKTALCLPGRRRKCAVEFPYIEEICKDVVLSPIPCLPEYFAGVCNYKGTIIPVVRLEDAQYGESGEDGNNGDEGNAKQIVVILKWQKYFLGILSDQEPFLTDLKEENRIRGPEKQENGMWVEKAYYMCDGKLYFLMDVEKTVGRMG